MNDVADFASHRIRSESFPLLMVNLGERVFAGAVNLEQPLTMRVTRAGEATRAAARVEMLGAVDPAEMIVFRADGEPKHVVTIFTDIDCGYCRQFHRDIDRVNALGIEVRYLFYPRTGPDTESWAKADKVWCADDRNAALTRAKLGGSIPDNDCGETPVAEHYALGRKVGVRGTPAMFAENGELIGGYLPPDELLETLEEIDN